MELTKQPKFFKRHRGRGVGERKEKKETREDKQRFWHNSSREFVKRPTKRPLVVVRQERRAKNKRARFSRKQNR